MSLGSFIQKQSDLNYLRETITEVRKGRARDVLEGRRESLRQMAEFVTDEDMNWRQILEVYEEWADNYGKDMGADDLGADDPGAEDDIDDDEGEDEEGDW